MSCIFEIFNDQEFYHVHDVHLQVEPVKARSSGARELAWSRRLLVLEKEKDAISGTSEAAPSRRAGQDAHAGAEEIFKQMIRGTWFQGRECLFRPCRAGSLRIDGCPSPSPMKPLREFAALQAAFSQAKIGRRQIVRRSFKQCRQAAICTERAFEPFPAEVAFKFDCIGR